jgi:hypothetical protein
VTPAGIYAGSLGKGFPFFFLAVEKCTSSTARKLCSQFTSKPRTYVCDVCV